MAIHIRLTLPFLWLGMMAPVFGQQLTVNPASGALPVAIVGLAYNQNITVSGGNAPYSWTVPALTGTGLTFSIGGPGGSILTISGTPLPGAATTHSFPITVTDSSNPIRTSGTRNFTLTINPQLSITTVLPNGNQNVAYGPVPMQATGGTGGGYVYSVSAGSLPPGISLSAGTITGTPTAVATFPFTIQVVDSGTNVATRNFSIAITGALTITTVSLPDGTVGVAYSAPLAAVGGTGAPAWSATGLPPGLTISTASGTISGTPTSSGAFDVSVTATAGSPVTKLFRLTVSPALAIVTTALPNGTTGAAYSAIVEATGGSGTRTWAATGLPAGLTINPATGLINGTPTGSGTSNVNVSVSDTTGSANRQLQLIVSVALAITTASLPDGIAGVAYSAPLTVTGGSGSRTWSATGLPTGLAIGTVTGTIAGTATAPGTFTVNVTVQDTISGSASKGFTLTINPGLTITTTALPSGTLGAAYTAAIDATGGAGSRIWSATGLPAGLAINPASGIVSGTPSAAGTFNVTVNVQDGPLTASKPLTLVIGDGLTITTATLPAGTQGALYSATLTATGGSGARTWAVAGLPTGITVNAASGVIGGTPTASGSFTLTVQVSDTGGSSTSRQLTLAIAGGLAIVTSSLPTGTVGIAYSAALEASGGSGTRTWSATGLPAGLTLNSATGVIGGTPTTAGTASVAVSVSDGTGTANRTLSLTVGASTLTITTASLPNGTVGLTYSASMAATGGSGSYSWTATGLPAGLSIVQNTGAIGGTPAQPGTSTAQFTVSDGVTSANQTLNITIASGLTIVTAAALPAATTAENYQVQLTASGNVGAVIWNVASGSTLPAGLTLNPSTGALSGQPAAPGTASFTIQVTDQSNNATASRTFTLTISQGLAITTSALPGGVVGVAYSATLIATGGSNYTWSATGLPPGLTLNPSSGSLSGTPTLANTYTATFTVTSGSVSVNRQLAITIAAGLSITTPTVLANASVGVFYQTQLQATGNTGAVAWAATTSLPSGLTLNSSNGILSGTPTAAGTTVFTVQLTDSANGSNTSKQFSLTVIQGLTIATNSLPAGRIGSPYSFFMQASGGSGSYSWTASGLPPGLAISTAGQISGSPTQNGSFAPFLTVSDGVNPAVTRQLTLQVTDALTIQTQFVPNGAVGASYSVQLTASGSGSYIWRVIAGALPPGLTLAGGTGLISGTPIPRSGGNYSFAVEAAEGGSTTSKNFTMTVLEILTTSLPQLTGAPVQLVASVPSGVLWSLAPGSNALPAGISLQPGGLLVGTPTTPATYTFTIQANWQGLAATQSYTVTVGAGGGAVSISTTSLPPGTSGVPYAANLTATGGSGNYLWQLLSGALPPGLTLLATGAVSGTPTQDGTFNVTIRALDAQNSLLSDVRQFTVSIGSNAFSIVTSTLPAATANNAYTTTLIASGGTAPYSWTVTAGQLPFGIGLTPSTGMLSGTPLVPGNYSFTVRATDTTAAFATRQYQLTVSAGITITTASLPGASVNVAYSSTLSASGGTGTGYTWVITSGLVPTGLSLGPQTGTISGIPTAAGNFIFTVQVTDSANTSSTKVLTLVVGGTLSITTATLPNGATGVPYTQVLNAAGGNPPLTWSLIGGSLPPGLQLNATTGQISGSPTAGGPYTFTFQVRDSTGALATRILGMVVTEGLNISTGTLPAAVEGIAYSQTLTAAGGTAPYTWSVAVGNLPPGLILNPNGTISGTPTAPANYSFIVQVIDAGQQTATKALTLIVNGRSAFVITTPLSLPGARVQSPYTARFQAQGGTPPYIWSLAQGAALPIGLTLDPDGNLTGSPTSAGAFTFSVRVVDNAGQSVTQNFSLLITLALGISTQSPLPAATSGTAYAVTLSAAGGQTGYRWSVISGALPAGLALSETTGLISGTPAAAGTFNFDVRVADESGAEAIASFTLVVRLPAAPSVTIGGLGDTVEPAQQPRITVTLGAPFPVALTGTVTMTFASDAAVPADDPAVVFANGRRVISFTVDAGTTQARIPDGGILQTGTVAGVIELTVRLEASGQDITSTPAPRQVSRVNAAPPVLRSVTARRVTGGLEVTLTGFATPRDLRTAVFRFSPVPGSTLQTNEVTVQLADGARRWYESEGSRVFGSQFTLTQQFNVQGDTSAVGSVTVTMTNAQGTSAAVTANF